MPDVWLIKGIDQKLHADDETGRAYVKKLKPGEAVLVSMRKPRNAKFHRKFFALLNIAYENQERYGNFEAFRKEVTMRAGHWDEHVHLSGKVSYTAKSIAFHEMDDLEFGELYQKAIDVIIEHFLPGTDPGELQQAADEVLQFA